MNSGGSGLLITFVRQNVHCLGWHLNGSESCPRSGATRFPLKISVSVFSALTSVTDLGGEALRRALRPRASRRAHSAARISIARMRRARFSSSLKSPAGVQASRTSSARSGMLNSRGEAGLCCAAFSSARPFDVENCASRARVSALRKFGGE